MLETGPRLSVPTDATVVWCANYKGEFTPANRRYCYPLTKRDALRAVLQRPQRHADDARAHRIRASLPESSMPAAIPTDEGVPFAAPHVPVRLSKLADWSQRLGVRSERITSAQPPQNGRPPGQRTFGSAPRTE